MGNRVFHTATIGGLQFEAFVSVEGPHLTCKQGYNGVNLGVCNLRHFQPSMYPGQKGWWIVKYECENLIDIHWFNEDQAHLLANEFGIALWAPTNFGRASHDAFYEGKAWESLKKWADAHPRMAKQVGQNGQQYSLPDWYKRTQI